MLSGPTYAETVKADAVDRIPQHSENPLECLKANIINHIGEALTASVSQSFTKIDLTGPFCTKWKEREST